MLAAAIKMAEGIARLRKTLGQPKQNEGALVRGSEATARHSAPLHNLTPYSSQGKPGRHQSEFFPAFGAGRNGSRALGTERLGDLTDHATGR